MINTSIFSGISSVDSFLLASFWEHSIIIDFHAEQHFQEPQDHSAPTNYLFTMMARPYNRHASIILEHPPNLEPPSESPSLLWSAGPAVNPPLQAEMWSLLWIDEDMEPGLEVTQSIFFHQETRRRHK